MNETIPRNEASEPNFRRPDRAFSLRGLRALYHALRGHLSGAKSQSPLMTPHGNP